MDVRMYRQVEGMPRLEAVRNHPLYRENYDLLEEAEQKREFCRHQMPHLLDVARIAYILNLERQLGIEKEVIYTAALLHDIGKFGQYRDGIPHEIGGKEIAKQILKDLAVFSEDETCRILQAVGEHRKSGDGVSLLGSILYESDKLSRACYICEGESACNWSRDKKNMEIKL